MLRKLKGHSALLNLKFHVQGIQVINWVKKFQPYEGRNYFEIRALSRAISKEGV